LLALQALLPDLKAVLQGAASTDAELGAAADILTTLTMVGAAGVNGTCGV
jgi:hypothetical protein